MCTHVGHAKELQLLHYFHTVIQSTAAQSFPCTGLTAGGEGVRVIALPQATERGMNILCIELKLPHHECFLIKKCEHLLSAAKVSAFIDFVILI